MKVNWFCPLPPAATAIAQYAAGVIPTLANYVDLELWTDQAEWEPAIAAIAPVQRYAPDAVPAAALNRADLNVYHIGNNAAFHAGIWRVSQRYPGLVILHDVILQEFARGLGEWEYLNLLRRYHGSKAVADGLDFCLGKVSVDYVCRRYSLTDCAVENALAVLVHSPRPIESLRERFGLPCFYAPMPYRTARRRPAAEENDAANPSEHRLIIFGHLGYNRRIEAVLAALGGFEHRERFRLDIYGQLWDPVRFANLVRDYELDHQVTIHGYVADDELHAALDRADLAINLRYPTRGEASYSQLLIWEHALPSLVSQTDWYSTLPEDCVAHVRPEEEVDDIRRHLVAYLNDPTQFRAMGHRGRQLLEAHHSPSTFADTIARCAEDAPIWRRQALGHQLAATAARQTLPWLRRSARAPVFASVGKQIAAMSAGLTRAD